MPRAVRSSSWSASEKPRTRPLRRRVGAHVRPGKAADHRRDVDQHAAASGARNWASAARRCRARRREVDGEQPRRRPPAASPRTADRVDAGVVDPDVDAARRPRRRPSAASGSHGAGVGDVDRDGARLAARGAAGRRERRERARRRGGERRGARPGARTRSAVARPMPLEAPVMTTTLRVAAVTAAAPP